MNETQITTVKAVRQQQVLFPKWMQDAVEGLSDTDAVEVTRKVTPFGTFLLNIEPVKKEN